MPFSPMLSTNEVQRDGEGWEGKRKVREGRPGVEAAHPSLTILSAHHSPGC